MNSYCRVACSLVTSGRALSSSNVHGANARKPRSVQLMSAFIAAGCRLPIVGAAMKRAEDTEGATLLRFIAPLIARLGTSESSAAGVDY